MGNHGKMSVQVWPTYLGLAESGDDGLVEPIGHMDYQRGQIWWETHPNGQVTGHAKVYLPKGVWTHYLYCHHPTQQYVIGVRQLPHPYVSDRSGWIDVAPIVNQDVLPRS